MQDTTDILIKGMQSEEFLKSNNPILLAGLFFILLLGATYIFFKYILVPLQHRHYLKEQDLKNKIKIQQMQQTIREQKIRSAMFHETVELERKRMAKELHDGLGSVLSVAKLKLETFMFKEKIEHKILEDTIDLLIDGGKELRSVIHELQPVEIEKHGIVRALENQLNAFEQNYKIKVHLMKMEVPPEMSEHSKIALFRVFQEILHNIHKHAHAANVEVNMFCEDEIFYAEVKDDGQGFEPEKTVQTDGKSGYGLNNMIERIKNLGGSLNFVSSPGEGTTVNISIPVNKVFDENFSEEDNSSPDK